MKVLIVEDEIDARKVLVFLTKEFFPNLKIIGEAASIAEAKQYIAQKAPDLLFLDVRLEDGTGIELLQSIEHKTFEVIFTTAYTNYAIQAIKNEATDYLLKPINPNDFKLAVLKAIDKIKAKQKIKDTNTPDTKNTKPQTIHIKTAEKTYLIPINDIIHLKADGAYTSIITNKQTIVASKNLKFFEKYLPTDAFIRPHQSHIVQKTHIQSIDKEGRLQLSNGNLVPVSFRKKSMVRNLLKNKN